MSNNHHNHQLVNLGDYQNGTTGEESVFRRQPFSTRNGSVVPTTSPLSSYLSTNNGPITTGNGFGSVYSSNTNSLATTINNLHDLKINGLSSNNGALFSNMVNFYLQDSSTSTSNFVLSKTIQLLLEIETRFNEVREEISIRILDPNDPFFIYLYLIDYNEFKKIKQNQNLLVSFEKFSPKLVDLFQRCSSNNIHKDNRTSDSSTSYILCLRNLSQSSLTLDIVELNEFKNLVHLSFDIPSASEEFVRNNYCSIYRKLKSETENLRQQVSSLDDQLSQLRISKAKDIQNLKSEFVQEKQYLEDKLKETEQRFSMEQTKWNDMDRCLKSKLQKLQLDLKNREDQLEKERKDYDQQYQDWKEKLNLEVTKRHNKLKEIEERNQQLSAEIELLKIERERTSQMAVQNEDEMNSIKKDLTKANEIIRKLQNEVKSCQEKVRILNDVTHKQEEIVGVKESTVERLSMDLKLCLQQLKNKEKEIERLNVEHDKQKSHCSELELQLTTSKKIIANMNKELDRLKLDNEQMVYNMKNKNRSKSEMRLNQQNNFEESYDNQPDEPSQTIKVDNKKGLNAKPVTANRMIKSQTVDNIQYQRLRASKERMVDFEDNENNGGSQKNYLFANVDKELPLKMVNLKTTTANRNQTNVLSTGNGNPKRRSLV